MLPESDDEILGPATEPSEKTIVRLSDDENVTRMLSASTASMSKSSVAISSNPILRDSESDMAAESLAVRGTNVALTSVARTPPESVLDNVPNRLETSDALRLVKSVALREIEYEEISDAATLPVSLADLLITISTEPISDTDTDDVSAALVVTVTWAVSVTISGIESEALFICDVTTTEAMSVTLKEPASEALVVMLERSCLVRTSLLTISSVTLAEKVIFLPVSEMPERFVIGRDFFVVRVSCADTPPPSVTFTVKDEADASATDTVLVSEVLIVNTVDAASDAATELVSEALTVTVIEATSETSTEPESVRLAVTSVEAESDAASEPVSLLLIVDRCVEASAAATELVSDPDTFVCAGADADLSSSNKLICYHILRQFFPL